MHLLQLARTKGKNLTQVGVSPAHARAINAGLDRAGSKAIAKIAEALLVSTELVVAACDAAWDEKQVKIKAKDADHRSDRRDSDLICKADQA
jgi:hypothetical protein